MVIVKEEGCNVDKITNTIQRFIPDITYDQNIGTALGIHSCSVPGSVDIQQGDPFFNFCLEVSIPASYLMQFDTLISDIVSVFQNSEKKLP